MSSQPSTLVLHPDDAVAVEVRATDIGQGHKRATRDLAQGAPITKYGQIIGYASQPIKKGEWVHVHNVSPHPPGGTTSDAKFTSSLAKVLSADPIQKTFLGYPRPVGRAGVRNIVVIVASVNCSATVVKSIISAVEHGPEYQRLRERLKAKEIHALVPITHGAGCAQAIGGESYSVLNRTLAGWVFHPNVVAALVIGLGCEGTTFESILSAAESGGPTRNAIPMDHFGIQEVGGTSKAIETGLKRIQALVEQLPTFRRQPVPVADLRLALNCGGSDAFSSLTANPALGVASDLLCAAGGGVALAEIPDHGSRPATH